MLTQNDLTVENCLDIFDEIADLGIAHVGFKDIGVGPDILDRAQSTHQGGGRDELSGSRQPVDGRCRARRRAGARDRRRLPARRHRPAAMCARSPALRSAAFPSSAAGRPSDEAARRRRAHRRGLPAQRRAGLRRHRPPRLSCRRLRPARARARGARRAEGSAHRRRLDQFAAPHRRPRQRSASTPSPWARPLSTATSLPARLRCAASSPPSLPPAAERGSLSPPPNTGERRMSALREVSKAEDLEWTAALRSGGRLPRLLAARLERADRQSSQPDAAGQRQPLPDQSARHALPGDHRQQPHHLRPRRQGAARQGRAAQGRLPHPRPHPPREPGGEMRAARPSAISHRAVAARGRPDDAVASQRPHPRRPHRL